MKYLAGKGFTYACNMGGTDEKDCLTTFSKVDFNTFEPEEDKIRIEDIAHALSMMTRANGHSAVFL